LLLSQGGLVEFPKETRMTADTVEMLCDDLLELPDERAISRAFKDRTFKEMIGLIDACDYLGEE